MSANLLRVAAAASREASLYLTVEQGDKLIGGLREEHFRLTEEDRARTFRLEKPETPASVALLVEHSRSSWLYYNDIVRAVQGFLDAAPEGNWYALATFSHEVEVAADFTRQKGKIGEAYAGLAPPTWNEVDTFDAVSWMLDTMSRMNGRRVLIVIGSGLDSFSARTLEDVQKKLESTNVVVFCVGVGSMLRGSYEPYLGSSARLDLLRAESFFKMLADKSGGQAWFPLFESAFSDVLRGIMQMLEFQYKLVYDSQFPADGKFHKLKVEAFKVEHDQRTDYRVRVREGWRFY
ncbi:MAG: VWA domain-containing protein [Acidobacteriota bacterium]